MKATFKKLSVGAAFTFKSESDLGWQGARGPWVKVGPSTYRELREGYAHGVTHRVGLATVEVTPQA
jgi:hypothetical protein